MHPATTFLDLVRAYADATNAACNPECNLSTHRMDAARDLGALKKNPELAKAIHQWVVGDTAPCGNCGLIYGPMIYTSGECPEHNNPVREWDFDD